MINQDNIQVRVVSGGIYLSVKTDKSEYGQFYNTVDFQHSLFVDSVSEAKRRFIQFYNKFE